MEICQLYGGQSLVDPFVKMYTKSEHVYLYGLY